MRAIWFDNPLDVYVGDEFFIFWPICQMQPNLDGRHPNIVTLP